MVRVHPDGKGSDDGLGLDQVKATLLPELAVDPVHRIQLLPERVGHIRARLALLSILEFPSLSLDPHDAEFD